MANDDAAATSQDGLPPRRSPEWFAALGFKRPFGLESANLWEKLSFGWGAPLLEKGTRGQIIEEMADCLPPPGDEAPLRAQQFADCYDQCQVWRYLHRPFRLDALCMLSTRPARLTMHAHVCRHQQPQASCGCARAISLPGPSGTYTGAKLPSMPSGLGLK